MKDGRKDYPSLERTVLSLLLHNGHQRTFSFHCNGERLWLKQPESVKANIWHKTMPYVAKLLNNNFFRPTVATDPKASLAYEAKRLRELKKGGITVPDVVIEHEEYLVLEDAGIPFSVLLGDSALERDEKTRLAGELSRALAQMHNRGFYHSRPALRDFAYKEGKIYFMDFEEEIEKTLTAEEAIVRDGFLYVHTLFRKLRDPELIESTLAHYHRALRPDLWENLITEAYRYRFTYFLLKPIYRYLGKDGVAIFKTLQYFRRF